MSLVIAVVVHTSRRALFEEAASTLSGVCLKWVSYELAGNVGLSATTLSRLAALEHSLEGKPISPGDLAESLGITDPSGRRLIRKLSACGLVSSEGSAQNHAKGRPSRLYRLHIDDVLKEAT